MNVWHIIVIFFAAVIIIQACILYRLFIVNIKLQFIAKDYSNSLRNESDWRIPMWAAMMILLMTIAIKDNDCDKFVQLYNRLYFFGVPKNVLNDAGMLNDFLNNCIEHNFSVKDGKKPFLYEFVKKENGQKDEVRS